MIINNKKIELNKKDIDERNFRILLVTIISLFFIYVFSIPISLMVEEYKVMFVPYLIIISFLLLILLFFKFFKKNILLFSYIILSIFYSFLVYSSIVLQPNMVCITILFFIFLTPMIILDYEWRIDLFTIIYSLIYIILLLIFKQNNTLIHEIFNVLSTLSLCIVIAHFSNKIMIDNIDMKRMALESAKIDYLTRLNNRIELFKVLQTDKNINAILMLDVDYFKKYNDTYSHQKGDECLVLVAKVLSNISNTYQDVGFYRYGGEEFVGIIKNRDNLKSIYGILEEIRGNIEALNIEHKESIHNIVTVSIGFTYIIEEENFDYKEALNQADIALYKAKDNGRNRVERFICE